MAGPTDWKSAEHIAALLEKTLSPNATVRHNVFLPVVGRPDRNPRQCDVVITYGKEPRTSVAIVEVQKRNRRPDITTFHGWVEKMREVGAQQLICVSERGYPRSVINEVALRIGPTVKLMTLRQIEEGDAITRLVMLPYMLHTARSFEILSAGKISLATEREQLDYSRFKELGHVSSADALFSVGANGPLISLNDLVASALTSANLDPCPPVSESTIDVSLVFQSEHDLWAHTSPGDLRVKEWPILVRVKFKTTQLGLDNVEIDHLVYRQESTGGAVAWVAKVIFDMSGTQMEFRIAFKQDSEGYLALSGVSENNVVQ